MENKSSSERILMYIKMKGKVTSSYLAKELEITKEGARKQLLKLEELELLHSFAEKEGVGRPLTYYSLSEKGLMRFPDSHAQITVELLGSIKRLLGENALDLLISDREQQAYKRYDEALAETHTLEDRLERLSSLRSEEGYMAEWKKEEEEYYLIENHCPICAAATECQGFCRAELKNFRQLIGSEYKIERVKHMIKDGQRCVYKIMPAPEIPST